jgi:hypothetical protein
MLTPLSIDDRDAQLVLATFLCVLGPMISGWSCTALALWRTRPDEARPFALAATVAAALATAVLLGAHGVLPVVYGVWGTVAIAILLGLAYRLTRDPDRADESRITPGRVAFLSGLLVGPILLGLALARIVAGDLW